MSDSDRAGHAALMDSVYRGQRHIYDITRKYYLFGRDRLIAALDCTGNETVLEIACGTGRNLAKARRAYPGVQLHGVDISTQMLKSARNTLGVEATLSPRRCARLRRRGDARPCKVRPCHPVLFAFDDTGLGARPRPCRYVNCTRGIAACRRFRNTGKNAAAPWPHAARLAGDVSCRTACRSGARGGTAVRAKGVEMRCPDRCAGLLHDD